MERPYVELPPPPPEPARVEMPPPAPRAPNPFRILMGALAVLVLVLAVPLVATAWLWGLLYWFGVHAPMLPTLAAVFTGHLWYVLHIAVLARAVRPLVKE